MTQVDQAQDTTAAAAGKAKTEVRTVTMDDGSVVDFAGRTRMLKSPYHTADGQPGVRFDFENGEVRTFVLPAALLERFAIHGASQKIGDATAGLKVIEDAIAAVDDMIDQLNAGNWDSPNKGSSFAGQSVLARAMAEAYPATTPEQIKTFLKGKTQAEKLALRKSNALKAIVARLEDEAAAKATGVDGEALLAGFGA